MNREQLLQYVGSLPTDTLVKKLAEYNEAYRSGASLISDDEYDHVWLAELKRRDSQHEFLTTIEGEGDEGAFNGAVKVTHPFPMLSTDKAYSVEEFAAYFTRVAKVCAELGIDHATLNYRATPKLDGMAGRLNGKQLVSRGESKANAGYDISRVFGYGVEIIGDGIVGEFVVQKDYFNDYLADEFEHPRGVNAGIASCAAQNGELNASAKQAIDDGAVRFVTYDAVNDEQGNAAFMVNNIDAIYQRLTQDCEYPTDGIVVETTNEQVKEAMGCNSHHHKWQIAKKVRGETADVEVLDITWQTARTGRCSPILNTAPTRLSGCTISNVTGHHAGYIRDKKIGIGAMVQIARCGEVVPGLVSIIKAAEPVLPTECACCGHELEWAKPSKEGADPIHLICPNVLGCSAQVETKLLHFFDLIRNSWQRGQLWSQDNR